MTYTKEITALKNLIMFDLETTLRTPILEAYIILVFVLSILSMYGGSGSSTGGSITDINAFLFTGFYGITISNTLTSYMLINSLFIGFLIIYSFQEENQKQLISTLMSYPISRQSFFIMKLVLYFAITFVTPIFSSFILLVFFPLPFDSTIALALIWIIFINEVFAITVALILTLLSKNFFLNIFVLLGIWVFGVPIFNSNQLPHLFVDIVYPVRYLVIIHTNDQLLIHLTNTLIGLCFCLLVIIFSYKKFINTDLSE